ncbi:MAG TPA: hypothetical protein VNT42_00505 [Sphingomonas sp.]|nr:hypothetical protein [Sphingomonas sp.]
MVVLKKTDPRLVRKAKPADEKFDAKKAHEWTMSRFPKTMARLAE